MSPAAMRSPMPAAGVVATQILDAALDLRDELRGRRVMVHHGTRAVPARLAALGDGLWQVRLEHRCSPPRATGSSCARSRRPTRSAVARCSIRGPAGMAAAPTCWRAWSGCGAASRSRRRPRPPAPAPPRAEARPGPRAGPGRLELAERLLAAGHEPPSRADLGDDAAHLPTLIQAGLAVRIGRDLYAHRDAIAAVADRVGAIIESEGAVTLARLRDELGTSRKYAEALLEHLDQARFTKRLPDDRRVLRRSR